MAGKIYKENEAILLAKMLLANRDLKNAGLRYEDDKDGVTRVMFVLMLPPVLEKLAQDHPNFMPIYNHFMDLSKGPNAYPSAYSAIINGVTDNGLLQDPAFSQEPRFKIAAAAILIHTYSESERSIAESFVQGIENGGDITGLFEQTVLATALYGLNYEGDFCNLVDQHYFRLKAEGFGESLEDVKKTPVQRVRDLSGCTLLADECGRVDYEMDHAVHPEGSMLDWYQKNGVQSWLQWLGDSGMMWCTQITVSLWDIIHYGNNAVIPALGGDGETFGQMRDIAVSVYKKAHHAAETCSKPFDVSVSGRIKREKTVEEDVPYEVKVGLFKKETRYRKERKTVTSFEQVTVRFNGWLLEHFERIEEDGCSAAWDYCLGSDGLLYVITSMREADGEFRYKVSEMLGMFESSFRIASQNTFVSVSHGWMGALDTVPMIPYTQRKYSVQPGGETYVFDFPLQLGNRNEYPFPKEGDGVKARLDALAGQ